MWGNHEAAWALTTIRRTWHSRARGDSRSAQAYALATQLQTPRRYDPETREFATADERQTFFDRSISDRFEGPLEPGLLRACETWYEGWIGHRLTEVRFVADDLQLILEEHAGNFGVLPEIRTRDRRLAARAPDYQVVLESIVGESLTSADVYLDDGIVLGFDSGELVFSPEDIRSIESPEVIVVDGVWIVSPDDLPFAWSAPSSEELPSDIHRR
jgi:hypothetical protein